MAAAVPVGKTVACKIKQDFQAYMDLGAMADAIASSAKTPMGDFRPSGGMQMTGYSVLYFAPDKGKLLRVNGKAQADMSVDMPAMAISQGAPQSIAMNMVVNIDISRV